MSSRKWNGEQLLRIKEVARHPAIPITRSRFTWAKWFRVGIRINGKTHELPKIKIAGVIHSSVEAIVAFFGAIEEGDLPQERRRRGR